ncbi:hypothetical protein TPHA_0O00930 [Tetrapisispora phaffii CBS 4417]|uniref:Calcofluor white hypersensitive protein n=1 Tax=Tetrapisispora phaffii (strain ATCC 24235 / CBS 4417 / NBRC 1672 / NRRL Y-8282 / UCD 70-5) TaxID=1071381 RepID=G8C1N4_TETPH|nr:hypothetical protein TPHA_0O00930 [Tetrapisispora phaffii CBS 4417]CCE66062.1 hypothetical protein TPHA_0O00930 [Tetrapisispora phaffii CBS 4417]
MVAVNGKIIPLTHTICASAAFLVALIVGCSLHYHKIVENAHYGYPDEWFPSVSATIGDRYPERSIFQILIALTSFPRFLLLLGHYYLNGSTTTFLVGVLRTVTCGGWVYITSTDDHNIHDIFMISYMVLTIPWNYFIIKYSSIKRRQTIVASMFYIVLFPLIYWYIQHQVHHVGGAYSMYAYFEWSLIVIDIAFDSLAYADFNRFTINLGFTNKDSELNWFFKIDQTKSLSIERSENDVKVVDEDNEVVYEEREIDTKVIKSSDEIIEILIENEKDISILSSTEPAPQYDSFIYILTTFFNSFIFWTAITGLGCSVWHFPLWYMGISGYEAAILGYGGCVVLFLPMMSTIIYQYGSLVGGLILLGSYLVSVPESRLLVVCAGAVILIAQFTLNLQAISNASINSGFTVLWILGLVFSVVLKMGFYSNNPLWPIMNETNGGWNKTGLIIVSIFGVLSPYTNSVHFSENNNQFKSQNHVSFFSKLSLGLGFGSLMFSIHQMLSDASTIIYWSWEGYNEVSQGPLQWPWSSVTCLTMLGACIFSVVFTGRSFVPCVLLAASTTILCLRSIKEWDNFIYGGLPYVVAIILIIPTYLSALSNIKSLWVFAIGALLYVIYILAHVWVVAYAFVPFGWLLRERIEVVLSSTTIFIIMGAVLNNGNVLKRGSALGKKFTLWLYFFSVLIATLTGVFTKQLQPIGVPQPYHPESKLITAGIWTIHFGLDNDMWASEDRMIELLKDMELDVFGVLESDTQRIVMGNRDLTSKLGHKLNMYSDYGPGPNKHTWGCALFSKFPIINSTHHLLPSPDGELAPAIHATLKTYNDQLVDVFVFHSGQEEDDEDRRLQTEALSKLMGSTDRPAILLSYLVTEPLEGNYNTYVSDISGMHDIDPSDDDRWCEYILYKNLLRTGYARVARGTITDTELQVGKFRVLPEIALEKLGDALYMNSYTNFPQDDDLKFPDMFLGEGERGHFYHVFDEPRYYRPGSPQNDEIYD